MMIPKELEAKILRLHHGENWPPGTIARQVGVHQTTVQRVLAQAGQPIAMGRRPSMVDPYVPFIKQTFEKYPTLPAIRLYYMVKERGYPGAPDHFRRVAARYRPKRAPEAFMRLRTLPGEQGQVDWGHFGTLTVGRAVRRLSAFVMVLSWSRRIFLRFFLDQQMGAFLAGHVMAFGAFGGVPRVCLYDNLKSAVLERRGEAILFNPSLLELSAHYCFEPRPVAIARGNEKGRVERAIRYVRSSFFAGLEFKDLDDLNAQATAWCEGLSGQRKCPEDETLTVNQAFELEKPRLLSLPDEPLNVQVPKEVRVGKTPYVRFDLNDYSVPHRNVRQTLTLRASQDTVRLFDGQNLVATHPRCWDRRQQIEEPEHIEKLRQHKQQVGGYRGVDRLARAVPASQLLLTELAKRGGRLSVATKTLLRLLTQWGPDILAAAIDTALSRQVYHPQAVRQILEKKAWEEGLAPPIPVSLPNDPKVRDLTVTPHNLADYDVLSKEVDDDHNN